MTFKEKVESVQAIVTIAAIIIGGIWTYKLFIIGRQEYPHANIEQNISHAALSQQANLLHIGITVTNTGSSRLLTSKAIIRVQQILPLLPVNEDEVTTALKKIVRKDDRFNWPLIAEREKNFETPLDIEPGSRFYRF